MNSFDEIQRALGPIAARPQWSAVSRFPGDGMIPVVNPAAEEVITEIADGTVAEAVAAVEVAYQAQDAWADIGPRSRSEILRRAFDIMIERSEALARLIVVEEVGKFFRSHGARSLTPRSSSVVLRGGRAAGRRDRARPGWDEQDRGPTPADRCLAPHHAMELSGRDGYPQDRAGARRRVLGHPEAGVRDTADRTGNRSYPRRSRRAGRRRKYRPVDPVQRPQFSLVRTTPWYARCRSPGRPRSDASCSSTPPVPSLVRPWNSGAMHRS